MSRGVGRSLVEQGLIQVVPLRIVDNDLDASARLCTSLSWRVSFARNGFTVLASIYRALCASSSHYIPGFHEELLIQRSKTWILEQNKAWRSSKKEHKSFTKIWSIARKKKRRKKTRKMKK